MSSKAGFKETEIGLIPEEWEIISLKELLKDKGYIRGPFGSALRRKELKSEGIPVYEQQHAIYNHREFRYFIDKKKFGELSRFSIKDNDLIISCSGNVGKVSIINKKDPRGIISQALLILRPNDKIVLPEFLKYFFTSKIGYYSLISRSGGSVQVNLAKKQIIQEIKIPLPPIHEQLLIIKILSNLDKKIELNQKMNQTLEEIAQAIFKYWFIDFEFPNNQGNPYKSNGGEMIDSELGKIPKGWNIKKIGDLIELAYGKGLTKNKRKSGKIPVYGSNGITDYHNEAFVNGPGLIIGRKGTVGKVNISYNDFWPIDTTYFVKSKIKSIMIFWYYLLNSLSLDEMNVHSAVPGLNRNDVYEILVATPNNNLFYKIESIMKSLHDKINTNINENQNLTQIRDSLLPRLMSGKIRVKENIDIMEFDQDSSKHLEALE